MVSVFLRSVIAALPVGMHRKSRAGWQLVGQRGVKHACSGVQAIRLRVSHDYWRIGKMPVRQNWPIMSRALELGVVGGGEEATRLVESLDYEYTTYDAVG